MGKGKWKTQTCQLDGKLTVLLKTVLWFVTTASAASGTLFKIKNENRKNHSPTPKQHMGFYSKLK